MENLIKIDGHTIFKTWQKATYFQGGFELRDRKRVNWATPINFPTVFVGYGAAIKSGNWNSCTAINTPDYVVTNYFDSIGFKQYDKMNDMWVYCKKLSKITWEDVENKKSYVIKLINLANKALLKLETLK